MNPIFQILIAVAIFIALGVLVPFTHYTAFTIPMLGSFGAFSIRFLVSAVTLGYMHRRFA